MNEISWGHSGPCARPDCDCVMSALRSAAPAPQPMLGPTTYVVIPEGWDGFMREGTTLYVEAVMPAVRDEAPSGLVARLVTVPGYRPPMVLPTEVPNG
ncbi:MAG TPA: hypothetical protein VMH41_16820 [Mycobacteriales bacterium]|nr:hypothetical protein [Mycobacteriales bacterium]